MTVLAYSKRRIASLVTFALACVTGLPAAAQFVPMQNYAQQAPPAYAQQQVPGAYAQQYQAQYQGAQYQAQYPGAQHPMYAAPRVASAAVLPAPVEAVNQGAPAPQVIEPVQQAPVQQGYAQQGYVQQSVPNYQAAPTGYAPTGYASSGCNSCQAAPATTSWEGYTGTPAAGCATGDCGAGSCAAYPASSYGAPACNVSSFAPAPKRQWFVGVYGLYMERNKPNRRSVAFDYDMPSNRLYTSDADVDGQFGGEIRFGSTFGQADACGGGQPFAWEIGYWQLEEDSSQATLLETMPVGAGNRGLVSTRNYAGLQYDFDGAGAGGFRPLNDYTVFQDDGSPALAGVSLLGVRVRQRFEMKNIELNFWRFGHPTESAGLAGGGLGLGGRAQGRGLGRGAYGAGGSCTAGACGTQSCRPPRRFFINGLAGIRYMKIDEDFQLGYQFTRVDGAGASTDGLPSYTGFPSGDPNVIFEDVEVDNQLVGFQLGCSMNWLVGCKWNVFADTNFGIYGNQTDVCKSVFGGGFTNFATGSASNVLVKSSTTDTAFVGEARFGVGYQVSCNCRLTAAYRVFGLSGIAIATDQTTDYYSAATAGYINNNSSLILQGLQTGVEWKY